MKRIKVSPGGKSYEIRIGPGLLAQTGRRLKEIGFAGKLVMITDTTVRRLYGEALRESLASEGFDTNLIEVAEGEEQKSLQTASRLYEELSNCHVERTTPILALGGGVIGDLSGFVAATYLRGVPLIQMPTTLLAQVDSSIGGKVAVNYGRLKNGIGAFHQPSLVLSDITTLRSLGPRELSNGLAEIIKSAVVWDREFFAYLEENLGKIRTLDDRALEEIVFKSVKIKAEIVEKDERDLGLRNILNYGHTIGHAIEAASHFAVGHGEAVAMGMLAAGKISSTMRILAEDELLRMSNVIAGAGLPTEIPSLRVEEVMQAMRRDKKVLGGKIRYVLPRSLGDVFVTDGVSSSLVERVLAGRNGET